MTTLSVSIVNDRSEKSEEQAIQSVLKAMNEPSLKGDLDELAEKI